MEDPNVADADLVRQAFYDMIQCISNLGDSIDQAMQYKKFKIAASDEKFELLCNHHRNHGNSHVPLPYEVNDVKLGKWVAQQKCSCNMARNL